MTSNNMTLRPDDESWTLKGGIHVPINDKEDTRIKIETKQGKFHYSLCQKYPEMGSNGSSNY